MLYVLKEQLLRNQNRELHLTAPKYSFGLKPIIRVSNQGYIRLKGITVINNKIAKDNELLIIKLVDLQCVLSKALNLQPSEIEFLRLSQENEKFDLDFQITSTNFTTISQEFSKNPQMQTFLNKYCNGKVEYVAFFDQERDSIGKLTPVTLSIEDFDHRHNRDWEYSPLSETRGGGNNKYEYFLPKGCYGFGLNITKFGKNQDWLQDCQSSSEWRIMYHGTKIKNVYNIVKQNFKPGPRQLYKDDKCYDNQGNQITVGEGIYFSDKHNVCIKDGYADFTTINDKEFAVIFQSRVKPESVRQSDKMKVENYFVVNSSKDVRPYRVLIYERQKI